jgi:hypothetical protein
MDCLFVEGIDSKDSKSARDPDLRWVRAPHTLESVRDTNLH